jgi:hypothetical protein
VSAHLTVRVFISDTCPSTTLVKLSSLVAKDALVDRLNEFVMDAKTAGRNLQRFGGRVGGAVDQIVAMNEYVLKLLENTVKDAQPQIGGGAVQRVFNAISPIQPAGPRLIAARRKEVETTWYQATGMMESSVRKLIHEAEANLMALDRLESQLDTINEMVLREDNHVRAQAEEVVSCLNWLHYRMNLFSANSWANCGPCLAETEVSIFDFF